MNRAIPTLLVLTLAFGLAACGGDEGGGTDATGESGTKAAPSLLLANDVLAAESVMDIKDKAAGTEVVVFGRIAKLPTEYAAFTLIDDELDYCGRGADTMDRCPTPWDYCCIQPAVVAAASIPVEVRDAEGNPVMAPKGELRLLDLVAIKGTLEKTGSGGLMIVVKDGVFRRERPTLADNVKWP